MTESKIEKTAGTKRLGLRRNAQWMILSTVFSSVVQLLVIVTIEKILNTKSLGDYTFALSISLPVFMFTGLSLRLMMVVDVEDSHKFQEYFGIRIFMNLVSIAVIMGIVIIGGHCLRVILITLLVSIFHSILMMSTLAQSVFQKHECMNYLGVSRIIQSCVNISSMVSGFFITGSLIGGLIFLCTFLFLKFSLYDLRYVKRFEQIMPHFDFTLLKQVLIKCWVISISAGIVSFTGNLPRYFIKTHFDTESLGFFTGISTTTMGMSLVVIAVISSALRRLAIYYSQDITKFLNLLLRLAFIAIVFGLMNLLFTFVAGEYFLKICFDETYVKYVGTMHIYATAGIFLALVSILGDTIISTRNYWWRILSSCGAVAAMLIAGNYMLPQHGLKGVAVMCIIGFGVELIFCIIGLFAISKKQQKEYLAKSNNIFGDNTVTEIA